MILPSLLNTRKIALCIKIYILRLPNDAKAVGIDRFMHYTPYKPPGRQDGSGEFSDTHGVEYEDDCLLGCCAMCSHGHWPTFQRFLLPPSSRQYKLTDVSEVLTASIIRTI
jgi:hypothetical protein